MSNDNIKRAIAGSEAYTHLLPASVLQEYVKQIPIYITHIVLDAIKISASILYTVHMFTSHECSSTIRDVYKSILVIFLLYVSVSFYYNIRKLIVISTWNTIEIMFHYKYEHIAKRIRIFNICMIVSMIIYSVIVYDYLCSDIAHWLVVICIYVAVKIVTTVLLYTKFKLALNFNPVSENVINRAIAGSEAYNKSTEEIELTDLEQQC